MREGSWRAVRSEEDRLAGAPRWSLMLTFLSRSAREMARGDVLPGERDGGRERSAFTQRFITRGGEGGARGSN